MANYDAATVDFTRKDIRHATFGNGVHRCLGSLLARTELKVVLDEWLSRILGSRLDPDDSPLVVGGMVNSVVHLPICWDV